ncbi:hypothetical protein MHYP_G00297570 [Metynnis hypsauchen]
MDNGQCNCWPHLIGHQCYKYEAEGAVGHTSDDPALTSLIQDQPLVLSLVHLPLLDSHHLFRLHLPGKDEALQPLSNNFFGEECVYVDPEALALALWNCLERHSEQFLERLQAI